MPAFMVVMVRMVIRPSETRAGTALTSMKKDTNDKQTIRILGMNVWLT
jgi:precorrin-3B methylase